jgi:preprotein translocase SecF subunit
VTGRAGRRYDIVGRMMLWFGISALVILPGLYFWLGAGTLNKGIDFTGGSLMQVEFKQSVRQSQVEEALAGIRLEGSPVQMSGKKVAFIRTKPISETKYTDIKSAMAKLDGEVLAAERVGPTISKELTNNAIKAVLFSALAIVLYLSGRFAIGGLAHGFRFGACAILATLHDVGVVIGVFAMLGYFLKWEIDSLFVTALLTVIGFSTHDTIVIFDRIRENLRHRAKGEAFDGLVNKSILQSFARSINTSLTVVLTLVALLIFGAENIRHFVLALLIGVITGTYSSIFNASQLLVLWQRLVEKQPLAARTAPVQPVTTARARELKPIEAAPGESPNGGAEAEPASPSAPESRAAKTKVKAKKRKRRF